MMYSPLSVTGLLAFQMTHMITISDFSTEIQTYFLSHRRKEKETQIILIIIGEICPQGLIY